MPKGISPGDDGLLPEGFHDILPPFARSQGDLEQLAMDLWAGHGYERVAPPMAEYASMHEEAIRGGSRALDSVRFTDPLSGHLLAIRHDITPQIGRIAQSRMGDEPRPLRLCYAGDTIRLKPDALRPLRTRTQIGAEMIGCDNIYAVSELVLIAIEYLSKAGLTDLSIDFTLPDLLERIFPAALDSDKANKESDGPFDIGVKAHMEGGANSFIRPDKKTMEAISHELDMKNEAGLRALDAEHLLPLIRALGPMDEALPALAQYSIYGALDESIEKLGKVAAIINDGLPPCPTRKVRLTLDPTERHGLHYQSWIGFTIFARGLSAPVGRGGCYYIQNQDMGEEAATGFSLYPDEASAILPVPAMQKRLYLPLGHDREKAARLRKEGWVTIASTGDSHNSKRNSCAYWLDGQQVKPI